MQFKGLLLIACLVSATVTAPTDQRARRIAVVKSHTAMNNNEARDGIAEKNAAIINTRFLTYEPEKRDTDTKKAVINTRFVTYEAEEKDGAL
ncbi:MAG: hypothetical protein Q9196_005253 [Gyalolechia fulgens]